MNSVRIGTRESTLALWQAQWVRDRLRGIYPGCEFILVPLKTQGDKILDVPLAKIGDKGLFTKELEQALFECEIDMAVHSLKDLPTVLPAGLGIAAYCQREEARDVFLCPGGTLLRDLPAGAVIGTSSLRRKAQLQHYRPDLAFRDLRGNLQTRWQKLLGSEMAGIVLAAAGVKRLGWEDRITEIIPCDIVLPAVGQGSIGVEIASDRKDIEEMLSPLNHWNTTRAVQAERALMRRLEGGCQVPVGAFAQVDGERIQLEAMVASLDGTRVLRAEANGPDPAQVGLEAAEKLLSQGAGEILASLR